MSGIRAPLFTPSTARDLHRNLAEWWGSRGAQEWMAERNEFEVEQGVDPDNPYFPLMDPATQRHRLLASETFLVTDDMSAVTRHAAATLPSLTAEHAMLPAECGLMVFNDRLDDHDSAVIPTEVVSWYPTVVNGKAGVAVATYILPRSVAEIFDDLDANKAKSARLESEIEKLERVQRVMARAAEAAEAGEMARAKALRVAAEEMRDEPTVQGPLPRAERAEKQGMLRLLERYRFPALPAMLVFLPYGDERVITDPSLARAARMTIAAWLLMDESLAVREKPRIERAAARRAVRAGLTSDLTVVMLRQPRNEGPGDGTVREYRSRWLVRGHWRRIPTAEQPNRVTWVHGYVKGPADAPLVVRDRVTVLAR